MLATGKIEKDFLYLSVGHLLTPHNAMMLKIIGLTADKKDQEELSLCMTSGSG